MGHWHSWERKRNGSSRFCVTHLAATRFASQQLEILGDVAQLGERTVRIRKVESSILFVSTKKYRELQVLGLFITFLSVILATLNSQFHECVPSTQIRTQFYLYLSNRILDLMEYDYRLTPDAVGVEL